MRIRWKHASLVSRLHSAGVVSGEGADIAPTGSGSTFLAKRRSVARTSSSADAATELCWTGGAGAGAGADAGTTGVPSGGGEATAISSSTTAAVSEARVVLRFLLSFLGSDTFCVFCVCAGNAGGPTGGL